ncbi:Rho-binding antiterminator [Methylomonas sp. MgM2]
MNRCSISCELHDYIEIACLYGYRLRLILRNQDVLEGKALDTKTDAEKREYLVMDTGQKQQIELNQIKRLQVLTPGAGFDEVIF